MNDDNIVELHTRREKQARSDSVRRITVDRSAHHFRIITRAIRHMQESGASKPEIVHSLRMIADELESSRDQPE
jgi:hypothetical protein